MLEKDIQRIVKLAKSQFILEDNSIHGFDIYTIVKDKMIIKILNMVTVPQILF